MKLLGFYKIFLLMLATIPLEINSYSQSYNTYFYSPTFISPQNISTTYNGNTISGQYLTILGKNNSQITKPFIFVEGFDPLNNQGFQDYINVYNNNFLLSNPSAALLKTLYDNSYDVIMLNFNNANDYIQNNAMLLIALINTINQIKVDQTDNMVVMGFSMGGLVARYALTWMEANSQNHHTRLFISHDTPHKGANFPIGLQKFVQDFSNKTSWINMAGPFLLNSLNYALPAARQMLVYYYANSTDGIARPSNDKINFFNELFNLNPSNNGYPSRPLKVAISNGNYSGFNQTNLNNNDKILSFDYWKKNEGEFCSCSTWYLIWHWNCDQYCYSFASDHITATVRAGFSDANPLEEFNVYSLGRHNIGCSGTSIPLGGNGSQHFSSANYPYDIAPGSYSPVFMDQLAQTITSNFCFNLTYKNNTCFIPTISALDLNIDLATPFDPNASKCISMFDFVYANSTQNIDHWNLNDGASNFIINHLLANEATTQHRNVVIPANTIIQGGQSYPISATGNISNAGIFSLKAGSSSLLTSGTSVSLNAGFNMEIGASLTVQTSSALCQNNIPYIPNYLANITPSMSYPIVYQNFDCTNYQQLPNYSSDSTYFSCTQKTQVNIDSILNTKISIYPNPASGNLTITLANDLLISSMSVQVFDANNNVVYFINPLNSYSININVSSFPIGLITIVFNINSGTYIYTRKVIKQ